MDINDDDLTDAKRPMAALSRMPSKYHDQIKIKKKKAKATKKVREKVALDTLHCKRRACAIGMSE